VRQLRCLSESRGAVNPRIGLDLRLDANSSRQIRTFRQIATEATVTAAPAVGRCGVIRAGTPAATAVLRPSQALGLEL
jgi:hypothetical protein